MAKSYQLIQTITVGSGGAASITFSNIPQTYTDLVIKVSSRSTTNLGGVWTGANVRLNGSTTSLTSRQLYGTGSAAGSATVATDNFWTTSNSATASTFDNSEIYIPNYTSSNNKSFSVDSVTENNATAALAAMTANLWSNTAAVTSITLVEAGNSFAQHSTATLYGIGAARATGGTITADSLYTYHTFTSSGTFMPLEKLTVDYLVVAGGGGGALAGGGGGAGGYRTATGFSITPGTSYTVTVGAGGTGGGASAGTSGSNSVFSTITSNGGGYAGSGGGVYAPSSGGSGGGGERTAADGSQPGGAGNTPSTSPSQGNNGGSGVVGAGGGGGGAGAVGSNGVTNIGGNGGNGSNSTSDWATATSTGVNGYYAGGGGGRSLTTSGTGGAGGGGAGSNVLTTGNAGTVNTGGGGGGVGSGTGGAGASGIVIIRYPNS